MGYNLSKEERETIIHFDEASDTAYIDTSSLPVMNKLMKLHKALPKVYVLTSKDNHGAKFECPKSLISFRRPSTHKMTEEQKKAAAARLAKARQKITIKN